MIVRRRGTHRAGGLFRGVGESPRGFRFGIDGDSRAGMGGLLEPDYQATPRGAWRQHAVIQDQIDPRARRQRRQPRQQIEWLELQMRGPVRPRAFQRQADVAGGGQVEALLRHRGPQDVPAESFQAVPPVCGHAQLGVEVEAVVVRVTPPRPRRHRGGGQRVTVLVDAGAGSVPERDAPLDRRRRQARQRRRILPAAYNGTAIGNTRMSTADATIDFLENHAVSPAVQRAEVDLLQRWQRRQLQSTGPDLALEGRIESYELAFRMQTEAPELMSVEGESEATRRLYGLDDPVTGDFGLRCLLARRFSESGVRFVQATHGPDTKWDHHSGLITGLPRSCAEIDRPVAGLIRDLKSRGLLDETLVLWGGEFGRTPGAEAGARNGRDHNPHGYTMFMAGGGVKGGHSHGRTDDYGYYAIENKVHIHDLHATILHLLGLDHERLTYRSQGRDFRLTDVAGVIVDDILA